MRFKNGDIGTATGMNGSELLLDLINVAEF
jgi:hypothetical protein